VAQEARRAVADVFISYANQDRESAHRLANALLAVGWSVWWDRKIIAGQSFDQVIERELESAKSVVVLWSRYSIASAWVKNEAAAASERGALVPACLESVKLPLEFRHKQTANLVDWNGDPAHSGFQALCEGISTLNTDLPHLVPPRQDRKSWWNRATVWVAIAAMVLGLVLSVYFTHHQEPQLVGTWKANVVESGVPIEIIWHILPGGRSDYVMTSPAGQEKGSRTWTYANGIIFETSPEGLPSSGSIRWIDENNFVLTIKDNGGDDRQRGVERHYSRL